jgi:signal peptidase II
MRWETRLSQRPEDPAAGLPGGAAIEPAPQAGGIEPALLVPGGESAPPAARPATRLFWWLTAAIIVADQATKYLVQQHLSVFDSRTVIAGLLDLVHVRNYGVAFGVLNDMDLPFKPWLTVLLALAALTGIAIYIRHVRAEERLARVGLSLILGGALGNLVDRARQGYVIDFVDVYRGDWHFWAFNVADASISIGAVLVFFDLLLVKRHASHSV